VRILFLLTQDLESPTGLGRYLPLAQGLKRLGHQVSIAALHGNFNSLQEKRFDLEGVDIHYVGQMHVLKQGSQKQYYPAHQLLSISLSATWSLSQAALNMPADIVHIGKPHPMNSLAGILCKYLKGKTLFLDCDDFEAASNRFGSAWQRWGVTWFENNMPRHVRHITTHTTYVRDRMRARGIPAERISFLPNGVDPRRFPAPDPGELDALRTRLGLVGKKVVAFIGSLSLPSHPVDLLLEAFGILHQRLPEAVLLLVGGGEDYQSLETQARELDLEQAVRFCGRISPDQVSLYYHLADVSVDPVHDNDAARGRSPLKMFESWVCGVPFVTADVGDRGMLLGDPPAGILARPGDPNALAQAILVVLEHTELSQTLRQCGLERVPEYYWDHLAEKLDGIYRQFSINS
jgi:glycosyltransferase involved in cell wall biosynthesis